MATKIASDRQSKIAQNRRISTPNTSIISQETKIASKRFTSPEKISKIILNKRRQDWSTRPQNAQMKFKIEISLVTCGKLWYFESPEQKSSEKK